MGLYTNDQVRQFYVVNEFVAGNLDENSPAGAIAVKSNNNAHLPYEPIVWFEYMTPHGQSGVGVVRTDLIPINNIEYISKKAAKNRKLKKIEISMNPEVNSGNPIEGEDYIFRLTFKGMGTGGGDVALTKTIGAVRAVKGETATTLLKKLVGLFNKTMKNTDSVKASVEGDKIVLEEIPAPFKLGVKPLVIDFDISFGNVYNGDYNAWGIVKDVTKDNPNEVKNGQNVVDMEWFYVGERADQLRDCSPKAFQNQMVGNIDEEYDFIDISYFYRGNNEDIQHSRKVITLACKTGIADQIIAEIKPDSTDTAQKKPADKGALDEAPCLTGDCD